MPDTPDPAKTFSEARQEITGDSWLDDLARASLSAAEAKFGIPEVPREVREEEGSDGR